MWAEDRGRRMVSPSAKLQTPNPKHQERSTKLQIPNYNGSLPFSLYPFPFSIHPSALILQHSSFLPVRTFGKPSLAMTQPAAHGPAYALRGDEDFEKALRPTTIDQFIGQERIKDNLRVFITAALQRGEALDHVILSGPPGLGKTTLAHIIASEMGATIKNTSGPALDKPASIAGLLTNLEEGDIFFIDEIHRLSPIIQEYLYSAMEDYAIDILIDSGPSARSVRIALPPFTLIGATTRKGLLTAPLRARFGIDFRYDYYTADLLQQIVQRSAGILRADLTEDGAFEIARRSRGTPRTANRLLRRIRDFAEVDGDGSITHALADHALNALDVDEAGLDDMDARILLAMMEKFEGGPVGLNTIAVAVGEDPGTIEEVYEPYLIQEGFMARTPRGRVATRRAYQHFNLMPQTKSRDMFEIAEGNDGLSDLG